MKHTILSKTKLSDAQYQLLLSKGEFKTSPKKEVLFQAGKVTNKLLLLESGLMRAFRYKEGTEYTHYFFMEKWFATDYRSYLTHTPSDLYIETLTETTYYEFRKEDILTLFSMDPHFERLGRIIAEKAYLFMVDRLTDFQTSDLKERYQKLIQHNPTLFQKVPQKYIASFLGVSEQSLSRIKADLK